MLNLVAAGPKLVAVTSSRKAELVQYLMENFQCSEMEALGMGVDTTKVLCILHVQNPKEQEGTLLAIAQPAEYILCHLMNEKAQQMIDSIKVQPPSILFNSLGDHEPVIKKIQSEFKCERAKLEELMQRENGQGVILAFLMSDSGPRREFHMDALFIQQEFVSLLAYLRIHAPRYLAKAFEPNAWHMVDLRIFDRYEAYDLQYERLLKAVAAMKLGYIVNESWNREVSTFADPVGTYHIRLLTFMEPMELKKLLLGLEYSQSGDRIVDLDLFWHDKKISWKDLLDDKSVRKEIKQTASFFPKSNFFAIQNDKLALIKYCLEEVRFKLPEDDKEAMREYEKAIRAKALEEQAE